VQTVQVIKVMYI